MERKKKKILKIIIIILCINGLLPFARDIKRIAMNKKESIEIWMVEQYLEKGGFKPSKKDIEMICRESKNYDAFCFTLAISINVAESSFKPDEISEDDAFGYFQILLDSARPYYPNKTDAEIKKILLTPVGNTRTAFKILEHLSVEFNANIGKVLTAYHAGTKRADTPPQDTIKYLYKIMAIWNDILLQDWWYHIVILIAKLGVLLIFLIVVVQVFREKILNYLRERRKK